MPTETAQSLIVVPTCNGLHDVRRLVASLPEGIDLFVIDSSSTDGTGGYLQAQETDHLVIEQSEFNHGATRQRALRERPGYAYYIYLTQDACLAEPQALESLLAHFEDPQVGAVCGRQLPHPDANPLAAHARYFNYPAQSRHKRLVDAEELGVKAAFMSNSFSAYRADALQAAGGFPAHVILAEDMYVAARMLQNGWTVAYAGDACCYHSHNYTPWQEFKRYFDTGVFHASEPWIQDELGGVSGEGRRFVLSELRYLGKGHRVWWPASLMATAMKMVGYHLGKRHRYLPSRLRQAFSMHKGYWN